MGNDTAKLSPQVMGDLTGSTHFTADEIHHFYREFEKGCGEGNLSMSRDQFKAMYQKCFPNGDPSLFADNVFRQFKVDDKGHIRFRDVMTMLTVSLKGSTEERLEWMFHLYDIHNTGTIESQDLVEIVMALHQLKAGVLPAEEKASAQQIASYIQSKADMDHDGRISKKEFVQAAVQSRTIQAMLVGTLAASSSPFTKRKNTGNRSRSGSANSDSDTAL